MRGYKYEKTHDDLDAIEESDDAELYGRGSDQDESITKDTNTIGVRYNGPLNDSDISDDEELQKPSSKAMSLDDQTDEDVVIDDQFVHSKSTTEELITKKTNDDGNNTPDEEEKDKEEQEIAKEPVQEL